MQANAAVHSFQNPWDSGTTDANEGKEIDSLGQSGTNNLYDSPVPPPVQKAAPAASSGMDVDEVVA